MIFGLRSLVPQVLMSRSQHVTSEKDPERFYCSMGLRSGRRTVPFLGKDLAFLALSNIGRQ